MIDKIIKVILTGCAVKSLLDNSKDVTKMDCAEKKKFFEGRRKVSDIRNLCYVIKSL